MENKKKKLNIEFTPFSSKNRSASVIGHNSSIDSQTREHRFNNEKPHIPHFRSSSTTKERTLTAHFGQVDRHRVTRPDEIIETKPSFELSLDQVDVDVRTVRIEKPEETNEEASINKNEIGFNNGNEVSFDYENMKKRTD